jgi:alpha-tubulin suppressor-like RCC1 family protein
MPSTRRSTRSRSSKDKEIVAPGFGTAADVQRLSADLGGSLPVNAVQAMMQSQGRGIRGKSSEEESNPLTSPKTSNAWADFIQEEGVSTTALNFGETTKAPEDEEPDSKRQRKEAEGGATTATATTAAASTSDVFEYDLDVLTTTTAAATSEEDSFGSLVQSGTLDSTLVGRKPLKSTDEAVYHLNVPSVLLPSIAITKVFASCNGAHAIAIDKSNQAYGWGRNEGLVLGNEFGDAKIIPTPKRIASQIQTAALGKSHTLFLKTDGTLHALGTNKVGQCGWKQNVKLSGSLKACLTGGAKGTIFSKISCGEDFSVALDDQGILYSTGSSEFGQLGNGETGEYFVSANKLAFANGYGFSPQVVFHQTEQDPDGDGRRNDQSKKTVAMSGEIRLMDIACGKHHTIALEAPNNQNHQRIFSWGCGNYGCLGHGRQADDYFPRHVEYGLPRGMAMNKLAAGAHCSLVLTGQGHVYYWGQHKQSGEATMKPQLVDALANNQHNVTQIGAGAANVACSTDLGNTVVWGSGPYGELGLGSKKSSAKPAFVDTLSGIKVLDMACGQGSILYVVKDDKSLPKVDLEAVEAALSK